jgi:hypothetical protein
MSTYKKKKRLFVRLDEILYNKIKLYAQIYSEGDVSKWVRHCLDDPKRKFLKGGPKTPKKSRYERVSF